MLKKYDSSLDVFIEGELVDLCIPTIDFAHDSNWYSWFNDKRLTRYLEQGIFPNSRKLQQEYLENLSSDRLVLIIQNKRSLPIGVISLSNINFQKRSCDIALVVSDEGEKRTKPFESLESMALLSSHAIDKLGMNYINAGQHIDLKGWQNRLELIGYKLDGIHANKFIKGNHIADCMYISLSKGDFDYICDLRGKLWDDFSSMFDRVKSLPKNTFCDQLYDFQNRKRYAYYEEIFNL